MKKIIVISDTHKNIALINSLKNIIFESDYLIHLGDYVSDVSHFKGVLKDRLITIKGNCDVFTRGEDEKVVEIDGVKLFLTHGHKYGVKSTMQNLGKEALAYECQAALFGHTHVSCITEYGGIKLINPGSFYAPGSGVFSYCYLAIWQGKIIPKIIEL